MHARTARKEEVLMMRRVFCDAKAHDAKKKDIHERDKDTKSVKTLNI